MRSKHCREFRAPAQFYPIFHTQISALTWLRGTIEVHDEMEEMRSEYESMKLVPKVTFREMLTNATLRIPLFIAVMVMIGQQLSGINAVSIKIM